MTVRWNVGAGDRPLVVKPDSGQGTYPVVIPAPGGSSSEGSGGRRNVGAGDRPLQFEPTPELTTLDVPDTKVPNIPETITRTHPEVGIGKEEALKMVGEFREDISEEWQTVWNKINRWTPIQRVIQYYGLSFSRDLEVQPKLRLPWSGLEESKPAWNKASYLLPDQEGRWPSDIDPRTIPNPIYPLVVAADRIAYATVEAPLITLGNTVWNHLEKIITGEQISITRTAFPFLTQEQLERALDGGLGWMGEQVRWYAEAEKAAPNAWGNISDLELISQQVVANTLILAGGLKSLQTPAAKWLGTKLPGIAKPWVVMLIGAQLYANRYAKVLLEGLKGIDNEGGSIGWTPEGVGPGWPTPDEVKPDPVVWPSNAGYTELIPSPSGRTNVGAGDRISTPFLDEKVPGKPPVPDTIPTPLRYIPIEVARLLEENKSKGIGGGGSGRVTQAPNAPEYCPVNIAGANSESGLDMTKVLPECVELAKWLSRQGKLNNKATSRPPMTLKGRKDGDKRFVSPPRSDIEAGAISEESK